jgi:hypothetical protein
LLFCSTLNNSVAGYRVNPEDRRRIRERTGLGRVAVVTQYCWSQCPRYQAIRLEVFVSAAIDVCASTRRCAEQSVGENDSRVGVPNHRVHTITWACWPTLALVCAWRLRRYSLTPGTAAFQYFKIMEQARRRSFRSRFSIRLVRPCGPVLRTQLSPSSNAADSRSFGQARSRTHPENLRFKGTGKFQASQIRASRPFGFTSTVRALHVQWITSGCAVTQDLFRHSRQKALRLKLPSTRFGRVPCT